jgi:hypothetical protein
MYFFIYKTVNKINEKYYIGKHQTKNLNDGYMGSGLLLNRAINKYGIKNFERTILKFYDSLEELNNAEKEFIILCEDSYNIAKGGQGGYTLYTLERSIKLSKANKGKVRTEEYKQKISKTKIENNIHAGSNNSHAKCWILIDPLSNIYKPDGNLYKICNELNILPRVLNKHKNKIVPEPLKTKNGYLHFHPIDEKHLSMRNNTTGWSLIEIDGELKL